MEVRRQARNSRPGPGLLTLCVSGLQGCRVAPSRLASPRSSPHDSLALPELGPMRLVGSPPVAVDGTPSGRGQGHEAPRHRLGHSNQIEPRPKSPFHRCLTDRPGGAALRPQALPDQARHARADRGGERVGAPPVHEHRTQAAGAMTGSPRPGHPQSYPLPV